MNLESLAQYRHLLQEQEKEKHEEFERLLSLETPTSPTYHPAQSRHGSVRLYVHGARKYR